MTKVKLNFNYFQVRLGTIEKSNPWDMEAFLTYLSIRKNKIECDIKVGEYKAELDRDTFVTKDSQYISFQIAKLRDNKIPFLKELDTMAKPLTLEPNQYLGEYITLVYDTVYKVLGIQSNLFSLNTRQVEVYLEDLRERYNQIKNIAEDSLKVTLQPIIDNSKVKKIKKAEIFREIEINAAVHKLEAFENSTFNKLSNAIGKLGGANFQIKISLGNAPKNQSLSLDEMETIITEYNKKSEDEKISMKVKLRENLEEELEVINLLTPRIENSITLEVETRRTISHEVIHDNFMEKYKNSGVRNDIAKVLAITNENKKATNEYMSDVTPKTIFN